MSNKAFIPSPVRFRNIGRWGVEGRKPRHQETGRKATKCHPLCKSQSLQLQAHPNCVCLHWVFIDRAFNRQAWTEDGSGSPTPHYWAVCYWQIMGDRGGGGHCLWLCTNGWLYQAPVNNSNLMLAQMVLVKLKGSQNKKQSHESEKETGRDEVDL